MERILISDVIGACLAGISVIDLEETVHAVAQLVNASDDPLWQSNVNLATRVLNAPRSARSPKPIDDLFIVTSCLLTTAMVYNKMIDAMQEGTTH